SIRGAAREGQATDRPHTLSAVTELPRARAALPLVRAPRWAAAPPLLDAPQEAAAPPQGCLQPAEAGGAGEPASTSPRRRRRARPRPRGASLRPLPWIAFLRRPAARAVRARRRA